MKKIAFLLSTTLLLFICANSQQQIISSPNSTIKVTFQLVDGGSPIYTVTYKNKPIVTNCKLGFLLKATLKPDSDVNATKGFTLTNNKTNSVNENWKPVWGELSSIVNNYNESKFTLTQTNKKGITIEIIFRVFNDGVGFRYVFPPQTNLSHFTIKDEVTQFNVSGNHKAFWIPGDYDTNEYQPVTSNLSEVDAASSKNSDEIFGKTFFDKNAVQTPLMLKSVDGLYINIHEAALVNYPAMNLILNKSNYSLQAHLVPDAIGNKAYLATPAKTPWRTIIVSDKATEILASKLILNLNDPSTIEDASWIKPTKYIGLWWEMHVGKSTWDYAGSQDMNSWENLANLKPSGKHGATTQRVKQYIDFASLHGFDGVLVEGWNTGWEDWFGKYKENVFDFVTPYPDFDVKELHSYAKSKNVKIIMHHETSGSVTNYERQMDTAYRFMKANGYDAVKTGYVGPIIPRGEHHDGQWMVNHYVRVAQKTADYKIMLAAHEPVRPTGLQRTYPNWLACEAARGMEFNAWSKGNKPEHETILAFTRFMGGPMDYTPGIFQLDLSYWDANKKETIHTTLAKQLALYVTIASPLQMASDLPESYEKKLDAFQFIKDVAVDWDDSKYLEAEPGDYITVARKAKGTNNWFLGAITDEQARTSTIDLSFLDPNKNYTAIIYADAADANYITKPAAYTITKQVVNNKNKITLKLAAGGGCAISFIPL
jgi:glucan 1,4-alpha-glucosidase